MCSMLCKMTDRQTDKRGCCSRLTVSPAGQASRSLCYGAPLDPELFKLSEAYEQEPAQRRFGDLSLRAADLRVALERYLGGWSPSHASGDKPTREKIEALRNDAEALEAEYAAHISSLPLIWKAMTLRYMTASDPPIMGGVRYEGRVDAYADMFICFLVNWSRAARLYIRYCSLRCHAWLLGPENDWRDTPEYASATALCKGFIEDIIASVPYVFGATRAVHHTIPAIRYQPPSLAGVFCMWPVFAAASSDFTTDSQRIFLRKTLKYISEEMGIGQAAILAGVCHLPFFLFPFFFFSLPPPSYLQSSLFSHLPAFCTLPGTVLRATC